MKIKITFKDPDAVYDAVEDAANEAVASIPGLKPKERDVIGDDRACDINKSLKPWIEYGEYLTVEFDTDANTATVQKVREQ